MTYLVIKRGEKYIAITKDDLVVNGQMIQVKLETSDWDIAVSVANDLNKIIKCSP